MRSPIKQKRTSITFSPVSGVHRGVGVVGINAPPEPGESNKQYILIANSQIIWKTQIEPNLTVITLTNLLFTLVLHFHDFRGSKYMYVSLHVY